MLLLLKKRQAMNVVFQPALCGLRQRRTGKMSCSRVWEWMSAAGPSGRQRERKRESERERESALATLSRTSASPDRMWEASQAGPKVQSRLAALMERPCCIGASRFLLCGRPGDSEQKPARKVATLSHSPNESVGIWPCGLSAGLPPLPLLALPRVCGRICGMGTYCTVRRLPQSHPDVALWHAR